MRQLTPQEVLSLGTLLQMEANGLSIARATIPAIQDDQFRNLTQSGITAGEARIRGLQQFIVENGLVQPEEVR